MSDFPKHYEHKHNKKLPARVAYTPTEAVNLEARGYTVYEAPKTEVDETKDQSNTGGGDQSADARNAAKKAVAKPNNS